MCPDDVATAELERLRAEAALAEAELRAAQARARLRCREAAAAESAAAAVTAAEAGTVSAEGTGGTALEPVPEAASPVESAPAHAGSGILPGEEVRRIAEAYAFPGESLDLGALVNGGDPLADVPVRVPLSMLNRHGLIAGATGTGKTRTLQSLAEQLAAHGVPVFAADIKGDLSGMALPGETSEKLRARTAALGQDWHPEATPVEFLALGDGGGGVPLRATVTGFGPLLLAKVLGLNRTQESSLALVFHYADESGLPLVDLADLRAVLLHLTSDEGRDELRTIGGISAATAGVILRELVAFAESGADAFFGEPEFDVADLLRTTEDGRGIVSLLEIARVVDRPALFSTFLMYLLAELFELLPEVGDVDKPKLVFFLDEAHLLFRDASKAFRAAIVQTVRLIRSKGVGVFFVTQTPKDIDADVLAQLGSRVQHQLRAFTPDDAKALRAAVGTYPRSGYALERVLQELGTGEAIVTVMSEDGAPTPVAWTRMRAPQGLMEAAPAADIERAVAASPLLPRYGESVDRESAYEILSAKMAAAAEAAAAEDAALEQAKIDAEYERQQEAIEKRAQREYDRLLKSTSRRTTTRRTTRSSTDRIVERVVGSAASTLVNGVIRGMFGTGRRR
jgi:DNA helicase HerA-like ATPase